MNIAELQEKVEKRFASQKPKSAVIYQFPAKEKEAFRIPKEHFLMHNKKSFGGLKYIYMFSVRLWSADGDKILADLKASGKYDEDI